MDGYTFQTHSVYRDKRTGGLLLLVHHNPMALCSLLMPGHDNSFDTANAQRVGVETIIGMRRSGDFEEQAPMTDQEFTTLLHDLLGRVSQEDQPFVQALIDQQEKK